MMYPDFSSKDYYDVLGVPASASDHVLKEAFRALIKKHHPDLEQAGSEGIAARRINEAYAVLRNPEARKQYDLHLAKHRILRRVSTPPQACKHGSKEPQERAPAPRMGERIPTSSFLIFTVLLLVVSIAAYLLINFSDSSDEVGYPAKKNDPTELWNSKRRPLSIVTATPPRIEDIESGAFRFLEVLRKGGMAGARAYSIGCHRNVSRSPSWREADKCASFDFAAAYIDNEKSHLIGNVPDFYFSGEREHQERNYAAAGAELYSSVARSRDIRDAIEFRIADGSSPHSASYRPINP